MFIVAFLDANIWGLLAVPVGIAFCFGPALATWAVLELNSPSKTSKRKRGSSRSTRR